MNFVSHRCKAYFLANPKYDDVQKEITHAFGDALKYKGHAVQKSKKNKTNAKTTVAEETAAGTAAGKTSAGATAAGATAAGATAAGATSGASTDEAEDYVDGSLLSIEFQNGEYQSDGDLELNLTPESQDLTRTNSNERVLSPGEF